MKRLELYQIDTKFLKESLETSLLTAIMRETNLQRNYEQFSFESLANLVNNLMNHGIEAFTPYKTPSINPDSVEMYGIYPFRNKDHTFQITGDEVFYLIHQYQDKQVSFFPLL